MKKGWIGVVVAGMIFGTIWAGVEGMLAGGFYAFLIDQLIQQRIEEAISELNRGGEKDD